MPGMDGFETAELLRSNPRTRHIPIIFITAGMNDFSSFQRLGTGAVDYLIKPIEPFFLKSKSGFLRATQAKNQNRTLSGHELEAQVEERTKPSDRQLIS